MKERSKKYLEEHGLTSKIITLSGSTEIEVEPFDSEPYEAGYDGYHETIQYESSVIDEIEVDYNFTTVGEQKIEIER